ncbi:hypothetical protein F2Q68_00010676 [Brassica cretica]|uniref:Uncharacterized protein n=1 Tax=Brassica cretica TaxID=69181 RepID=A0A8S9KR32_BRACR|nr:hypothetical protein F2Q68_00010676 [Brassica cretica]
MDTRQTTALAEMNKNLDDLRLSQTQQSEEIRKDLGGEIAELKAMMEKFLNSNSQSTQQEGSSGLTAADKSQKPDPPDRFTGEQTSSLSCPPVQSFHSTRGSTNRETPRAIPTPCSDKDITANLQHVSEIKL